MFVTDPWTHKINQVSRWLESSRTNGEDLRISGSYSKRLQEGHENLQISGGAEKTSRREKEKNCTGSHCRSDSCTAAFTVSIFSRFDDGIQVKQSLSLIHILERRSTKNQRAF